MAPCLKCVMTLLPLISCLIRWRSGKTHFHPVVGRLWKIDHLFRLTFTLKIGPLWSACECFHCVACTRIWRGGTGTRIRGRWIRGGWYHSKYANVFICKSKFVHVSKARLCGVTFGLIVVHGLELYLWSACISKLYITNCRTKFCSDEQIVSGDLITFLPVK